MMDINYHDNDKCDILVLNGIRATNLLCTCPVKTMPATTTKRCSVWTGHIDCGKGTLMLSFMSNDSCLPYCVIIVIISFISP